MKISPNPKPFRYSLGERGETVAADWIRKKGFKILQKNYKCPLGEIDLIAQKKGQLHFIEVKTRSNRWFGDPSEAVDWKKQQKLIKLASWYLKEKGFQDPLVSLDVAAVIWKNGETPEVRLIENAFEKNDKEC